MLLVAALLDWSSLMSAQSALSPLFLLLQGLRLCPDASLRPLTTLSVVVVFWQKPVGTAAFCTVIGSTSVAVMAGSNSVVACFVLDVLGPDS